MSGRGNMSLNCLYFVVGGYFRSGVSIQTQINALNVCRNSPLLRSLLQFRTITTTKRRVAVSKSDSDSEDSENQDPMISMIPLSTQYSSRNTMNSDPDACTYCNGVGIITCEHCGGEGFTYLKEEKIYQTCYDCIAKGKETCPKCNGDGKELFSYLK
mmetsp:Transcript_10152/g.18282  ORF Transcript_10152/g.18282 Transcript_10152/m.18282 type:complete len:157 (-) Transcript_10152:347-817(-)